MDVATATGWRRVVGLAFAPPRGALWIPRCRSVHTVGMRFALHLVWVDGAGRVLRIDLGVPPRRVVSCRGARAVLEWPAPGWLPAESRRRRA